MKKDVRQLWLDTVLKFKPNPDKPGSELYWAPEIDAASRDKIKEIQSEKLQIAFRYLYECSPFYQKKFKQAKLSPKDVKSIEDLHKIPITTRAEMTKDVEENPPWGTYSPIDNQTWSARGWMLFATSGTTATPRPFRYTIFDRDMWAWADARALWMMGVRPGDRAFLAFSYGGHVLFWGVHNALNLMGVPVISGGGLGTKERAKAILTYEPTVLGATPSYAIFLGRTMQEMGYDPAKSSIRLIITGGEPAACIPSVKKRIEELWGARLHEFFGCTEAAPASGGCLCAYQVKQEKPSTHLFEDQQIWELLDPETLEPVEEGKPGVTVITNLCSEGSPLLRFFNPDFTIFSTERCGCGMQFVRAAGGFYGRADDMLKIKGVNVFPSAIESILRNFAELGDEFEIVVSKEQELDVLAIRVETKSDVSESISRALEEQVIHEIKSKIGIRPKVMLLPAGTLPRTEFKARRVVRSQFKT